MSSCFYGISFKNDGKIYYFKSDLPNLDVNTKVIVDTEKGSQLGMVRSSIEKANLKINPDEMKAILKVADEKDYDTYLKNSKDASKALLKAQELAKNLELEMKFVDASFTFDRKQLLLSFLADERIDFRELAKKLALVYKTRIELRQIGARDKAREVGGLGPCGRALCCTSFLRHIDSVSMNMAKNQNLSLNPTKINGSCGRLLCCLAYEDAEYSRCQKGLPAVGQTVKIENETGKVISVDVLNRTYKVDLGNEIREIKLDEPE